MKVIPYDEHCTCVQDHSWYGKEHCSGCAVSVIEVLEKENARLGEALAKALAVRVEPKVVEREGEL